MKKLLLVLLFIVLKMLSANEGSGLAEGNNTEQTGQQEVLPSLSLKCYQFDKRYFDETLDISRDLIVSYTEDEVDPEPPSVFLHFTLSPGDTEILPTDMQCTLPDEDNTTKGLVCSRFNKGRVTYRMAHNTLYLHTDYLPFISQDKAKLYILSSKGTGMHKGVPVKCQPDPTRIAIQGLTEGSEKDRLAKSIKRGDTIIDGLDYSMGLAVAIGEDNTPHNRNFKCQNGENFKTPLVLRSFDNGRTWEKLDTDNFYGGVKQVKVLDRKHIVILGEEEIWSSADAGENWKEVDLNEEDARLQETHGIVLVSPADGSFLISKDKGAHWYTVKEKERPEQNATVDTVSLIALLQPPHYRVNHQTGKLQVEHEKEGCGCSSFSMPLVYGQSNTRKGMLGQYWSLGIESHIVRKASGQLLFFDARKSRSILYRQAAKNDKLFLHGPKQIQQIDQGYMIEGDKMTMYFNTEGKLSRYVYADGTYEISYDQGKPDVIMKRTGDTVIPYIRFSYRFHRVVISYYDSKEKATLVLDEDGLLTEVLHGDQRVFTYQYDDGPTLLTTVMHTAKHVYFTIVYDDQKEKVEEVTEYTENAGTKGKVSNYLFTSIGKRLITTVSRYSPLDGRLWAKTFYFEYTDNAHRHLYLTSDGINTFGFDQRGLIDSYQNGTEAYAVTYDAYRKLSTSTVKKGGKIQKFKYDYTSDAKHLVKKIMTPQKQMDMAYDEKGQITALHMGKVHLRFVYTKIQQPLRIILKDRGELRMQYDEKGRPISEKSISYSSTVQPEEIAMTIHRTMAQLRKSIAEGSIKHYPTWLQ